MAEGRYAIVQEGVVDNVIIWDPDDGSGWEPEQGEAMACDEAVAPGWRLVDGEFLPPDPVAAEVDLEATLAAVDAERLRRQAAGFEFAGRLFQAPAESLINISGASTAALMAKLAGAQPGDLRWSGGDEDFSWIAADNSALAMDAQTMIAFGLAAMSFVERLTKAGRAIKNDVLAGEAPADVAADPRWP